MTPIARIKAFIGKLVLNQMERHGLKVMMQSDYDALPDIIARRLNPGLVARQQDCLKYDEAHQKNMAEAAKAYDGLLKTQANLIRECLP